jgi:hypothetical protein
MTHITWGLQRNITPRLGARLVQEGNRRDGQFKFGLVSGCEIVLRLCCHGYVSVNKNASGDGWRMGI